ncbi:hypothetical protein PVAP13_8KG241501 [Panicum virgatum]|uniref:Uncharacterized protein n=1 Tax=Panicum virgatum TaxID=38727 RepID=A0A8T0PQT7_PANVG|nr:hypothetical protein PVAP13_8KG241501 [Panicum virgatum]KAG2562672.1 hypothetical protein PVAP13_8KG241501 [Panicum virgatum]
MAIDNRGRRETQRASGPSGRFNRFFFLLAVRSTSHQKPPPHSHGRGHVGRREGDASFQFCRQLPPPIPSLLSTAAAPWLAHPPGSMAAPSPVHLASGELRCGRFVAPRRRNRWPDRAPQEDDGARRRLCAPKDDGDGGLGPAQRDDVHLYLRDVRPMLPQARGPCIPGVALPPP